MISSCQDYLSLIHIRNQTKRCNYSNIMVNNKKLHGNADRKDIMSLNLKDKKEKMVKKLKFKTIDHVYSGNQSSSIH
jgi:hypothetical protein